MNLVSVSLPLEIFISIRSRGSLINKTNKFKYSANTRNYVITLYCVILIYALIHVKYVYIFSYERNLTKNQKRKSIINHLIQ